MKTKLETVRIGPADGHRQVMAHVNRALDDSETLTGIVLQFEERPNEPGVYDLIEDNIESEPS